VSKKQKVVFDAVVVPEACCFAVVLPFYYHFFDFEARLQVFFDSPETQRHNIFVLSHIPN